MIALPHTRKGIRTTKLREGAAGADIGGTGFSPKPARSAAPYNQCGDQEFKSAVYIYEGADTTPFDLNSKAEQEPLMVAPAKAPEDSSEHSYGAGFLAEGTYTISYTCSLDNADAANDLSFAGTRNVEVVADETKTEDFGTN